MSSRKHYSFALSLGLLCLLVSASAFAQNCPLPPSGGVHICLPLPNTEVTSPVEISAAASAHAGRHITAMRIYIDNRAVYTSNNDPIDTHLNIAVGQHLLAVVAYDNQGSSYKATEFFTVTSGNGFCLPTGAGAKICSPSSNSTVLSPVMVSAGARPTSGRITAIRLYIDNTAVFTSDNTTQQNYYSINTSLTLSPGTHHLVELAYQSTGGTQNANENFTVTAMLAITPAKQQLITVNQTVSFSANLGVVWDVDGITGGSRTVGTITTAGLYTPAPSGGAHVIGATGSGMAAHTQVTVSSLPGVFTWHNDNARTGANTDEIVLTPQNVNVNTFGKLFSVAVDGLLYAQPLYALGVTMQGVSRNVVYAATEHDSLYAIDAESGAAYWQKSLIDPPHGITSVPSTDLNCPDLTPEVGITSTPVIDKATGTLYLLARTKENGAYFHRLHAIDIVTGAEKFGGPVAIAATMNVNSTQVTFDPFAQHQRAALLLTNGHVVIGFTSLCDLGAYHGWLISYNAGTLAQETVLLTTPSGTDGAIWMSGAGPATDDAGNLYFASGNGTYDGITNFGDSVLKVPPPMNGVAWNVGDWFTPYNQDLLNLEDLDQGSGGVLLLPDPGAAAAHRHLLLQTGKDGVIHLIDRDNLGKFCAQCTTATGNTNTVQEIAGKLPGEWATPAYWNHNVYFGATFDPLPGDNLKAFSFNADGQGLISPTPTSQSDNVYYYPGSTPAVSSNGNSNGIVWTIDNTFFQFPCCDEQSAQVMYAYDALDLTHLLYSTKQAPNQRDKLGGAVKFTTPTVANGRVYVGSQGSLNAYGLLP